MLMIRHLYVLFQKNGEQPPEELVKITGIKTLRFCHPNAFLAAADEKEDAVKAARMALDINKNGNARLT